MTLALAAKKKQIFYVIKWWTVFTKLINEKNSIEPSNSCQEEKECVAEQNVELLRCNCHVIEQKNGKFVEMKFNWD